MKVSEAFVIAVKMWKAPAYNLVHGAGLTGSEFSKIVHGALPITERRQRQIDRIGVKLGLRGNEIFDMK